MVHARAVSFEMALMELNEEVRYFLNLLLLEQVEGSVALHSNSLVEDSHFVQVLLSSQ